MKIAFRCAGCSKIGKQEAGAVNRARRSGRPLYCSRGCAGKARRITKSKAQRVEEKRIYDMKYRAKNREMLKAKKANYFQRTYDPVSAAIERKKKMPRHVEYCRRPEYRAWKAKYDKQYLARKNYGPFAEAAILTLDLNREIKERTNDYEIRQQNKTGNKTQIRRREGKAPERSRTQRRRDDHPGLHG